jgi:hypothetical protein
VVEEEIKLRGFTDSQRSNGALLDFRLQATAAERATDAAILIKQRLGPDLLRTRATRAGNQREHNPFAAARGVRQSLEDEVFHLKRKTAINQKK